MKIYAVGGAVRDEMLGLPVQDRDYVVVGATPEEIYQVIDSVGGWAGGAARQNGMEAWRLVFRPDLPTIERVVELTDNSFAR